MSKAPPFELPLIDTELLRNRDKPTEDLFYKALTDIGFLVLKNHGVPKELTDRMEKVSEDFYKTTHEERMKVQAYNGKMISEGSAFTDTPFVNSPNDASIKLDLEEIDNVFYDYLEELCVLGQDLLECCENVLGLREGRLLDNYEAAGSIVDALFYDKTPPGKWGTNAHYDNCMMTILRQDMVGGLELQHKGLWYPVKPMKDCFVVNFGKMMEHFTYGVIKATYHRVKNNKDQMRVSWPMFLGPNLNRDLTQLIEFKWNEKHYIDIERERIAEENKEIEENAAHVHLNVSEKGHHVWEMIERRHIDRYRELMLVQNSKKRFWIK